MSTFPELGLSQPLLQAIADLGFEETTPIQKQTIPLILQGKDVIGQAQTGTGKTAAFGIPMMERVDPQNPNIQALVVAPTRELAVQVAEELNRLGRHKGVDHRYLWWTGYPKADSRFKEKTAGDCSYAWSPLGSSASAHRTPAKRAAGRSRRSGRNVEYGFCRRH